MEQTNAKQNKKTKLSITPQLALNIVLSFIAFFISRVVIFQSLNPVMPAFLSCLSFSGSGFYAALVFSFLGIITKSSSVCFTKYIIFLSLMLIVNLILPNIKREKTFFIRAISCGVTVLVSGLIFAAINSLSVYYTILAVLETVLAFSLCFVLEKGVSMLTLHNLFNLIIPEKEDIISIALLTGSVIAGSSDIFVSGISINLLFSVLFVIVITYSYGTTAGIAAASIITLVSALSSSTPFELMCIFTVAAIFSSVNSKIKKIPFIIIFALTCFIFTLYLKKSMLVKENIYSFLTASVIFILLPLGKIENTAGTPINADEYIAKLKMVTTNRLRDFSYSFMQLSKTLSSLSEKRANTEKKEISALIDDVAAQLCVKCNMKKFCWENNFYSTYQTIFSMLSACEQKGAAEETDITDSFRKNCIKRDSFLNTINRMYDIHKTNMLWQNKITESRELVSQQLSGVSAIINNLSHELSVDMKYNSRLSDKLQVSLEKKGYFTNSVVVSENESKQTEIILKHPPCYANKDCTEEIIPIVNSVLKKNMCREYDQCIITREKKRNICTIKLVEEKKFRVIPAVSGVRKDGSMLSGDSATYLPLSDGRYLLALSDGMGSGTQAHKESAATIELFEDFISAGFNKETAVNMINSVLVLKSDQESFSTLDVCTLDLRKGEAEFIKIGAVTSFIKHTSSVETIKSTSLPVGILSKVDADVIVKKLADLDVIVMVSDGILDSSPSLTNKEDFVAELLKNINSTSPADIADEILKTAIENSGGSVNDDMTVLAAKVYERKLQIGVNQKN